VAAGFKALAAFADAGAAASASRPAKESRRLKLISLSGIEEILHM
jgi:hypothetical protein